MFLGIVTGIRYGDILTCAGGMIDISHGNGCAKLSDLLLVSVPGLSNQLGDARSGFPLIDSSCPPAGLSSAIFTLNGNSRP